MPGVATDENDAKFKKVSEELTAEKASKLELEEALDTLRTQIADQETQIEELTGATGVAQASDYLEQAAQTYIENPDDVLAVMELLNQIEEEYTTTASQPFIALYTLLMDTVKAEAATQYYDRGIEELSASSNEEAIEDLTKAWELDNTNGSALYNLGHAYRNMNNTDKADEIYKQVIELFPDTDLANNAAGYISAEAAG